MIEGKKVQRPTKAELAEEIAGLQGLPAPKVSDGASVDSDFLDALHVSLTGQPTGGADAYRKTETLMQQLGLTYDPYWDTSESAPAGGGTVTSRAYSRIRSALTGTPRCFLLSVTDAAVGEQWEKDHTEVYRYDKNVTARQALNDAGPGSRVIYYATGKSTHHPKHFIATATVGYIGSDWSGPWEIRIEDYRDIPNPVHVDELSLDGWNRQHAITEISPGTFRAILAAGGLEDGVPGAEVVAGSSHQIWVPPIDPGGIDVAKRIRADNPIGEAKPTIAVPATLPAGVLTASAVVHPTYTDTPAGVGTSHPALGGARSRNRASDKEAEERAVELATKALVGNGWDFTGDCQLDGVGYDLEFKAPGRRLKVEVKGIQGARLTFNLTPKELWRAETDSEWVLVAVTSVLSPKGYKINFLTRDRVLDATRAISGYRLSL